MWPFKKKPKKVWKCTFCGAECITIRDLKCGAQPREAACPLDYIDPR